MIRASKKTRQRRRLIKDLDAKARMEVFERDGFKCVRCGSDRLIQWAHVLSRTHKVLRWLPENSIVLCSGCHLWWHHEPALSGPWFRKNWPERYDYIVAIYNGKTKFTEADLRALHAEAGK